MESEDIKFNDKFVDLIEIRKHISNCDEGKLSKVLSLLPTVIDADIVQSILFSGLYQCLPQIPVQSMQTLKNNINQIIDETTTDSPLISSPNNLSIFDLHDDVLVYLCQFLDMFSILNVEKTCRFFVSIARNPLSCSRFTMNIVCDDYDDPEMKFSLSPVHLDDHTVTPWQCIPSSRYSSFAFSTSINFNLLIHEFLNDQYHLNQLQTRFCNAKQLDVNITHFKSTNDVKLCARLIHSFNHVKQLKITFSKNTDPHRQNDLLLVKGLPTLQPLRSLTIVHTFGSQMIRKLLKTKGNQLKTLVLKNVEITKSVIDYINTQHNLQCFEWNDSGVDLALQELFFSWCVSRDEEQDDEVKTIDTFFNIWCQQRDANIFSFQCNVHVMNFWPFLSDLIEHLAPKMYQFSFILEGDESGFIIGDKYHFKGLHILNLTFPLQYHKSIQSIVRSIPDDNMLRLMRIHVSIDHDHEAVESRFTEIIYESFNKLKDVTLGTVHKHSLHLMLNTLCPWSNIVVLFGEMVTRFKEINTQSDKSRLEPNTPDSCTCSC